jgi:hypothetical protein
MPMVCRRFNFQNGSLSPLTRLVTGLSAAIHGIDDLRMLTRSRLKHGDDMIQNNVPIYCDAKTLAVLKQRFP